MKLADSHTCKARVSKLVAGHVFLCGPRSLNFKPQHAYFLEL